MYVHSRLLVTCDKDHAETSYEAREYVDDALVNDSSFVGEEGHFGAPVADWFVIGGNWSGELSRATWGKDVYKRIAALEKQEGIQLQLWRVFYATGEEAEKQQRLATEVEALYKQSLPAEYKDTGLMYLRDPYSSYGYEDDAMLVTPELYDQFLQPYEGVDQSEGAYVDLDWESVSQAFIGTKWLVVVDYHS
jgi:hypothetical protein